MNMSVTYWLDREDKEKCFQILRKGTAFEKEPAYITAYEVCKGLNEHYSDDSNPCILLRDAHTGKSVFELAKADNIDKLIKWLREKHGIFYFQDMNLCIPLKDPLSMRVKRFWESEDDRQKQFEEYCKNDVAVTASEVLASVKKERDELKKKCDSEGRVCDQFIDILNALGVKDGALYPARGQSKVDALAKAAKQRAEVIFSEHQSMQKQIDELNERVRNQEIIIKAEGKSLAEHRKQIHDLGSSLRNIKEAVDSEMDDLMAQHGDDIIPVF